MKKIILILSFFCLKITAQYLVKNINYTVPKKSDVFQIIEEDKKQLLLFFSSEKQISSLRLNEKFEIVDSLSIKQVDKKFNQIVGYSIAKDKYYTYWTNGKSYISKTFDYKTKTIENSS